jgi:hypothetical protein
MSGNGVGWGLLSLSFTPTDKEKDGAQESNCDADLTHQVKAIAASKKFLV